MKRIVLVLGLASIPSIADAQPSNATVESILANVPARSQEAVSVIRWNADYSYQTLKDGSGTLVCYDRSDERGRRPYAVQCTSRANLPRVTQNRRFRMESADRVAERAMVAAAEADGIREMGEYGSVWYRIEGADQESAGVHTTIMVPGATTASTGLPDNRDAGGAYIMGAGTSGAHIMVPGR